MSSDVISEAELQKKGVKYIKNEKGTTFYVEKTDLDKFKDYSYRALGTPFTVVVDAAIAAVVVVVVGTITIKAPGGALHGIWRAGHPVEEKKGQDRTENDSDMKNK